ncbi:AAA family ATPase [Fischerella sp. JS2]|uniref:NACHT domain-containing protein n=1 Tax=Fischerella sp. JS2 TaxID=2597771 RepID=UPI0028E7F4D6|nr:AAA family ATPase [Fischerella sp. JS2]
MPHSNLTANICTDTNGTLAVGKHILKIGSSQGAIAELATIPQQPNLLERSTPVLIRQPPSEKLLEREKPINVNEAIATLKFGQSVEFYSPVGFGKSFLLRYCAQELQTDSIFSDGVISLSSHHPYVSDLLQVIWEAFYRYESDTPYKSTDEQIRHQIQDKHALVILDDGDQLIQDEVQKLRNAASNCTFLVASTKQRLPKPAYSTALSGLSIEDALVFVETKMQRSLKIEELPAARSLCIILKGNPMHLQLAITYVLAEGRSLAEIVSQLPNSQASIYLIQQIIESLSHTHRNILEILAVMGEVGLLEEEVAAITQQPDASEILKNLQQRYLIQQEDFRYRINKTITAVLPPAWKLGTPLENTIAYFINWTQLYLQQPQNLLVKIDAIVQILEVAVRASRWQVVLHLAKAVEGLLALSKRWGLWEHVLQRGLQASQAERDKASEAWALHQLGTHALCLEENTVAFRYFTRALELRESLSDFTGLALTRQNFNLLPLSLLNSQPQNIHNGSSEPYTLPKIEKNPNFSNHVQKSKVDSLKNGYQPVVNHQIVSSIQAKEADPLPPSSVSPLTRMNIVEGQTLPPPLRQNFLLSPQGVITTGILASSGLLAWFYWGRTAPQPIQPDTSKPQATTIPLAQPQIEATSIPSPIAKPTNSEIPTLSPLKPLKETKPIIDPALTPPTFPEPTFVKPKQPQSKPTSAPVPKYLPTPTATPEPTPTVETEPGFNFTPVPSPGFGLPSPITSPTPTFEPPSPETTSKPIFTPSPTQEPTSSSVTIPSTFTPSPTPEPTSKSITITSTPEVTVTPIEEPSNQN